MMRHTSLRSGTGLTFAHGLALTALAILPLGCDSNSAYPTRDASADAKREGGPVYINGMFNYCPDVVLVTSPNRVTADGTIQTSAHATDPEKDPLTFQWKADAGSFANPIAQETTFTCPNKSTATITLNVSDGHCIVTQMTTVLCTISDAGVVDGGSTDAAADAKSGSGGSTSTGGKIGSGGTTGTGGAIGTGGRVGTGGTTSSGGATASGGVTTGSGGRVASGGTTGNGGVTGSGGATSGGTSGGAGAGGSAGVGGTPASGGSTGSGGGQGTGGTMSTGGTTGGGTCDGCSIASCDPTLVGCDQLHDPGDQALCQAAYECFLAKQCTNFGDPNNCYCGTAVMNCSTDGAANGPCVNEMAAAAKTVSTDASGVLSHITDPTFPLGRAANLAVCQGFFCMVECRIP